MKNREKNIKILSIIGSPVAFCFYGLIIFGTGIFCLEFTDDLPFDLRGFLTEAYGFLLDILFFGILIALVNKLRTKGERFERYKEELEDYKDWEEKEGIYRKTGIIKRFIREKVKLPSLSDCFLEGAKLNKADLSGVNLNGANLNKAELNNAKFIEADLGLARFVKTKLCKAELIEACLVRAKFIHADLTGAKLIGANLNDARLFHVDLIDADLTGAKLIGAVLYDVDLYRADLNGADFTKAKLANTQFTKADLSGANFHEAEHLTALKLSRAKSLSGVMNLDPALKKELQDKKFGHLFDEQPKE